jgi:hypothetical protein
MPALHLWEITMPQDNVVPILRDPLIEIGQRIDAAYARTQRGRQEWQRGRQEWIEGSLELAAALLEGRERMGNVAFGAWLSANGHDHVSHQDRAALINLASDPALARSVLTETTSQSYQLIWDRSRIRFTNISNTNSSTGNRGAVYSTGDGPWTNVIDDRVIALIQSGVSRQATADRLTQEFGLPFTKGMVINATRRLGLVERTPAAPRRPAPAAPPRRPAPVPLPQRHEPLPRELVHPGVTLTPTEFTQRHGHVVVLTAEEEASHFLAAIVDELRRAVRGIEEVRRTPRRDFTDYWLGFLRNPRERHVVRLREALAVLEPRVVEARAWLDRAEALLRDRPAPQAQAEPAAAPMSSSPTT